jgi:poly-gamma-glutamate capsule biosynthesis protein CapA/YwtB (metallophosphatase superfamily)
LETCAVKAMSVLRLIAVGDIFLRTGNNRRPFQNVGQIFNQKDILFGNLETVLSTQGRKAEKAVVLYSPPENVQFLKSAGFDVLNIANNHILDLGIQGFRSTLDTLSENSLAFIGANAYGVYPAHVILERKGIRFAFLGYTANRFIYKGIPVKRLREKRIIEDIEALKPTCDFVAVSLHWGIENVLYPSPKQIKLAHKLIDRGASLVLGHHPHVIQGIEEYKNGLIAYSLGNFQFDPRLSQSKTNESIMLVVEFTSDGIKGYEIIPVVIDEDFLPAVAQGEVKDKVLTLISEISERVSDGTVNGSFWFEEIAAEYLASNMKSYTRRIKKRGVMPLIECAIWLISPFCLRCYAAILSKRLRMVMGKERI